MGWTFPSLMPNYGDTLLRISESRLRSSLSKSKNSCHSHISSKSSSNLPTLKWLVWSILYKHSTALDQNICHDAIMDVVHICLYFGTFIVELQRDQQFVLFSPSFVGEFVWSDPIFDSGLRHWPTNNQPPVIEFGGCTSNWHFLVDYIGLGHCVVLHLERSHWFELLHDNHILRVASGW